MPSLLRAPALSIAVALTLSGANADWRSDIGHDRLAAELGSALPDGSGVPVTIVEAESSDRYLPQGGTSPINGSGNFSGKTLTDKTLTPADKSTGTSGHAAGVASFYFGNTTSIAPGISEIDCYNANDWVDHAALRTGTDAAPSTELSEVQNHSWIGSTGSNPTDERVLQRLDFLIERDRVITCVGLNNGSGSSVPKLLAPAFNTIAVGRADGGHSTGTTPGGLSTPGRTRPDIVAPATVTSHATPMVSSAAALLVSSPSGGSRSTVVYKAILLAGATKHQIPGWTSTPTRPLDPHFGVGQLNIYNSYHILDAGEQNRSSTTNRASTGSGPSSLTPGSANEYFFEIPAGKSASEFSAVLTWNRTITDTGAGLSFSPAEILHDLALTLEQTDGDFTPVSAVTNSDSAIDNVEHIYATGLPPGQYRLSVTGDSSKEYAVAWRTTLAPGLTLATTAITVDESAATATLTIGLDSPTLLPVTIDLTTTRGTTSDNDFTPLSTSPFTIPAGTTTLDIPITISPDTTHELDETFTVTLSNPVNATLNGSFVATVTITDDDPGPTLAISAPTPTSEAAPTLNFTLNLSNPSYLDVTVEASTTDVSATAASDFTAITSDTITIPAGSTSAIVPVQLTQDDTHESDETLALILSNPLNTTLPGTPEATATITDDDPVPVLTITAPPPTPEASTDITFTLTLSNPTHLDTTAAFTTTDATAQSSTDYTTTANTLAIPAGSLTTTITVPLLDDTEPEPDQTFSLDLSDILNAVADNTTTTATLLDDDFPIVLQSLTSTPGPTSTDLTWPAVPGRTYRIDTSPDLLKWTPLTTLTASQSPTTTAIPLNSTPLFFRIVDTIHP